MKKHKCWFHSWKYYMWIHYKYWGPVWEYGRRCRKCHTWEDVKPWSRQEHKIAAKATETRSRSSC